MALWVIAQRGDAQTWLKTLGQPGRAEKGLTTYRAPDGSLYVGGSVNDSALVMRIDNDGNVLWARHFKPPGQYPKHVFEIVSAPDGTLVGVGNGLGPGPAVMYEGFHFRMDPDGNFLWVRHWSDPKNYSKRIVPLSDQEYLLFACHYDMSVPTRSDNFTARIDATTGNVNWLSPKLDLYNPVPYVDDIEGVATIGTRHYMTGRVFTNGSPVGTCRVAITCFDWNGAHEWTRFLLYPNNVDRRMYPSDVIAVEDSLTIAWFGDINGSTTNYRIGLIRLDTLGNVAWARAYDILGNAQEQSAKVIATPFGYVMSGRMTSAGTERVFLLATDRSGNLLWAKTYGPSGELQGLENPYAMNLCALPDGCLFTGFVRPSVNEFDMLLARTDSNGEIACSSPLALNVTTTGLPTASFNSPTAALPFSATLGVTAVQPSATQLLDECQLGMSLGNDTTLCGALLLDATTPGASYEWQDGSMESTLLATVTGEYWVRITVDCCTVTDTISVSITGPLPVTLGTDTTLCSGSSLVLELSGSYSSITWQDGSTGNGYVVDQAGAYWVVVEYQGCTGSDTIMVSFIDPPVLQLGPEMIGCVGDTIELSTGLVGLPHLWQDGSTDVGINATATGTYWVVVGQLGCSGSDTVEVTLLPTPLVDLGTDTVICGEVLLVLSSGYPSANSTWQDGTQAASITVTGPGLYSVVVDMAGCIDSAAVTIEAAAPPSLVLVSDTVLCDPIPMVITAMASPGDVVTWQNGVVGPVIVVTDPGVYTATATNVCGAAEASVQVLWASPFAPPDTIIVCHGEQAMVDWSELSGAVVWSTGHAGPVISLPEGTYGYTAIDTYGCTRTGALTVHSAAGTDGQPIVPNVFSPNGDGVNDVFRLMGVERTDFSLEIFNRWGQSIHISTDPTIGWDGKHNGRPVPDGTYMYIVHYMSYCGPTGMRREIGHVTLLR